MCSAFHTGAVNVRSQKSWLVAPIATQDRQGEQRRGPGRETGRPSSHPLLLVSRLTNGFRSPTGVELDEREHAVRRRQQAHQHAEVTPVVEQRQEPAIEPARGPMLRMTCSSSNAATAVARSTSVSR